MKIPSLCTCFCTIFSCSQSGRKKAAPSGNKVAPKEEAASLDQKVCALTANVLQTTREAQAPRIEPGSNGLPVREDLSQRVKKLTRDNKSRRSSSAHEKYNLRFKRMHSRERYKSISQFRQDSQKIDYILVYKFINAALEVNSRSILKIRDIYASKIVLNAFKDYLSKRLAEGNLRALISVYSIIDLIKPGSGEIPSLQVLKAYFPDDDSEGVNLSGKLRRSVRNLLNDEINLTEECLKEQLMEVSKKLEMLLQLDFGKFIKFAREKQATQKAAKQSSSQL